MWWLWWLVIEEKKKSFASWLRSLYYCTSRIRWSSDKELKKSLYLTTDGRCQSRAWYGSRRFERQPGREWLECMGFGYYSSTTSRKRIEVDDNIMSQQSWNDVNMQLLKKSCSDLFTRQISQKSPMIYDIAPCRRKGVLMRSFLGLLLCFLGRFLVLSFLLSLCCLSLRL